MNEQEIKKIFYIDKNYSKIKELLKNSKESWSFNILAKIALYENNIDMAINYFNLNYDIQGCAYCYFLKGNIQEARILLGLSKLSSPFSLWLYYLCDLMEGNITCSPTYFQIRNFYEQDLEMLFRYKQTSMIEKLIKNRHNFEMYNQEIHKYNGRVLKNNGKIDEAQKCLKESLDLFYNDPETHYLLGEIYENIGLMNQARREYHKAIEVNNGYYPALQKLALV